MTSALFWRLLAVAIFFIGTTIHSDTQEYVPEIPYLTEKESKLLHNFRSAPKELFTNKKPNFGVFSEPIQKLNHQKTSYLPLDYRLKK